MISVYSCLFAAFPFYVDPTRGLTPPARQDSCCYLLSSILYLLFAEATGNFIDHFARRQPRLLQRVAVTESDRLVLQGLAIDGDAPRRADFVLPAVALADRRL